MLELEENQTLIKYTLPNTILVTTLQKGLRCLILLLSINELLRYLFYPQSTAIAVAVILSIFQ